jgi:serine/threonine protein kinase
MSRNRITTTVGVPLKPNLILFSDDWVPPFDLRDVVRIRTNQQFSDFYTLYEEIGEGKFGKVFRCVEKATNLELAAKCIRLKKDADLAKVEKEVTLNE